MKAPLLRPRVIARRQEGRAGPGVDPVLIRAHGHVPVTPWEPPTPADVAEVVGAVEACRAALAKCRPPRPYLAPEPPMLRPEEEQAVQLLKRAVELVDHGRGEAALQRMREAARLLRPAPPASGKVAAGGSQ